MIGFLGIYYVWTLNVSATTGYTVRGHEIEKRDLNFALNQINLKIAEAESLTNLADTPSIAPMEPIDNPDYLVLQSYNLAFIKKD